MALVLAGTGRAAAAPAVSADPAPGDSEVDAASAPVALEVEATGLELDERSVRDAILRELELENRTAPAGAARVAILLRVVSGGELTVTIQGGAGRDLSRSVATPARADEVPEVTALLVGNLARDEASDLLIQLRRPEPEPEPAPDPPASSPAVEPELPLDSINLSLVYPLTTRARTDERRFVLELGLFYSRIGALSGIALELGGVAHVLGRADGLIASGIGYWNGGPGEGVRLAGAFGVGAGVVGVSAAGVTTVERGDVTGAQLSGAVNWASGNLEGVQATAIFNTAGDVDGAQLAAGFNVAGGVDGAQASALFNVADGDVNGVQLSSGLNLARHINGMQISLVNVGGDVDGGQIGIVNVARDVDGVQLGLVNVAREVDGVSLAYVPYSERGRTQAVVWFANSMYVNLGIRFDTGPLYVMPSLAYDPRGGDEIVNPIDGDYAPGFSLGHRLHFGEAFADLDVNYSNRSTGSNYNEHDIDLRYRLLGGYQLTPKFGVFAGGGVRHHFRTQAPRDEYVKPEFSVGVQLL
jgi:hypothetical protein